MTWWGPDGREVDEAGWAVLMRNENGRLRESMSNHLATGKITVRTRYTGEWADERMRDLPGTDVQIPDGIPRMYRTTLLQTPTTAGAEVVYSF